MLVEDSRFLYLILYCLCKVIAFLSSYWQTEFYDKDEGDFIACTIFQDVDIVRDYDDCVDDEDSLQS